MHSVDAAPGHEWLTVREVAELLRCHPRTIYDACAAGELPHIRLGRSIRVPRRALQREAVGLAEPVNGDGPAGEPGRALDLVSRGDEKGHGNGTS